MMPADEHPPEPADAPRFVPPDQFGAHWPGGPIRPDLPPPPPSRAVPAPADQPHAGSSTAPTWRGWVIAVFVAVAVLPSIFFLAAGFSDDDTATASATGTVLWLTGIALLTGAVGAALTWAIARRPSSAARSTGLGFLLALAGLWGLVTGFLGGAVISMERHPTWDDA